MCLLTFALSCEHKLVFFVVTELPNLNELTHINSF